MFQFYFHHPSVSVLNFCSDSIIIIICRCQQQSSFLIAIFCINSMERVVRKGYLVENGNERLRPDAFTFSGQDMGFELLIFYEGNGESFKFVPDGNENSSEVNVSAKIQELLNYLGIGINIALFCTYDEQWESSAWITVRIHEEVITKLCEQLIKPKISVRGNIDSEFPFNMSTRELKPSDKIVDFEGAETINRIIDNCDASFDVEFSVLLEWTELKHAPEPPPRKKLVLSKLLSNKMFADCSIITGDGKEVSCHKSVLAANSDVFHAMLTNGLRESQSNKIEMKELTEDVVNQLLAYLYEVDDFNPKELKEEMAFELLKAAHQYNISGLEQLMLETLLDRTVDIFDMNLVLGLYLFTEKVEGFNALCDKMADILRRKPNELASSSGYLGLLDNNPKEAANLTMKLLKLGLN